MDTTDPDTPPRPPAGTAAPAGAAGTPAAGAPLRRRTLLAGGVAGLASAGLVTGCDSDRPTGKSGPPPPSMVDDVDPLIGTATPGNTYPGAHLPFGFVAASPDTDNPSSAGYTPTDPIVGFSQTHVSGTGGDSRYGNFRVTPITGRVRLDGLGSGRSGEHAEPGYYKVLLTYPKVLTELTATRRCAVHRYTFPDDKGGHLIIDASSVIMTGGAQQPKHTRLAVVGNNSIEGSVTVTGGWGDRGGQYTLHFAAQLDQHFADVATFVDGALDHGFREVTGGAKQRVGAVLSVRSSLRRAVQLRIAVSFVSVAQARSTLDKELGFRSFDAVRADAKAAWRDAMSRAVVSGGTAEQRTVFATALYHCQLMPHDVTGENVWWQGRTPHYEDFYTLWDTHRAVHPLLTLIQPKRQAQMVNSLIETYQYTGWLPDARIAGVNSYIQGGTSGDVVIADAVVKKLPGIDVKTGYRAIRKDGEQNSPKPQIEGRELDDYLRLGYLAIDQQRPDDPHGSRVGSRTLEYAYEDFCIGRVAEHVGDDAVAAKYQQRAKNWAKLWDSTTGVIRPRYSDGRFLSPFDPNDASTPYFYEGSAFQYTTMVPHDVPGLIDRFGGDKKFVAFLDRLFSRDRFDASNEPDLLAPYLYLHAGRPDRTADLTRQLLATGYHAAPDGLPGNDDAGAMSAWYVWTALGLYPNPGQDWYYLTSPLFEHAVLRLADDRTLTITAPGASDTNRYVQSVQLGGKPVPGPWLRHRDLLRGGELRFRLGSKPSGWGVGNRPPKP
ncbi:GH92 family glycosyl hydrolase [Actinocatenispora comari]|uniref:Alpha-1,2-mannosidase n=1 Tax=Actinocatenispora comari TaxID=2807577 RepID=A0A8J4EK81_9ACTN|nr:GH92 family glycosyl hydrolase [Actinocatenispora comari]GIL26603.1 hypothetical protein NUM_18570 [Actinocatenispora comari]